MNSNIPARLAYTGADGFPRVIPIGFLWLGMQFIMGTATTSPKVKALIDLRQLLPDGLDDPERRRGVE